MLFVGRKKYLIGSLRKSNTNQNKFKKQKTKMTKTITHEKLKSRRKKEDFQNCSKLAFFSLFQISNPNIFVIFVFFLKKHLFLKLQTYFCSDS